MNLNNKIINEINETKTNNQLKKQAIIKQIENDAELSKIYLECKNLIFEIAKQKHNNIDAQPLEIELKNKKEFLYELLKKQNYDIEFLKNPYSCTVCKDTGKTINGYCSCYYKKLTKHSLETCGLALNKLPQLNTLKFDFYKDKNLIAEREFLVKILQDFVKKCNDNAKKNIVLTGQVGVGKTHLLHAVVNEAILNNKFVIYTTAFNLNKDFLKYHCAKLEEKDEILNNYLNCDILCIDDLGTENILKNVTCEYLFLIINERLAKNKCTIITTNLTLTQILNVYDERIYSRFKDKQNSTVLNLKGEDIRKISDSK